MRRKPGVELRFQRLDNRLVFQLFDHFGHERLDQQPPAIAPPTTAPSGLATMLPHHPTYSAPMTPTTSEESDPEAC